MPEAQLLGTILLTSGNAVGILTDHKEPLHFPDTCQGLRITLTHDPIAIEQDPEPGLYLAGHTHCGQIRLPFIHPNWAPTSASPEYVCGVGASGNKVWLTTPGVGTSVIPFRFEAPASIELITINWPTSTLNRTQQSVILMRSRVREHDFA